MSVITPPVTSTPTTSTPGQGGSYPWQQPVDPQALNLTRAMALQESSTTANVVPNYGAKGGSGEFGAYQWMPGMYESQAKQYGLDPADKSPEAQDKVAYSWVKSQKDAGLQPAEIAALWNSGSKNNWQNHAGVNSDGVAYDTPAYVKGVQAHYNNLTAQSNPNPQDNTQVPTPPQTQQDNSQAPVGILGQQTPPTTSTDPNSGDVTANVLGLPFNFSKMGRDISSDFAARKQSIVENNQEYADGKQSLADAFINNAVNVGLGGPVDILSRTIFQPVTDILNSVIGPATNKAGTIGAQQVEKPLVAMYDISSNLHSQAIDYAKQALSETDPQKKALLIQQSKITSDAANQASTAAQSYNDKLDQVRHGVETFRDVVNAASFFLGANEASKTGGTDTGVQTPPTNTGVEAPAPAPEPVPTGTQVSETGPNDLQIIKNMITPKPTVGEARLAMSEGRLYKGTDPTVLGEGSGDQVATTNQQLKSTMTIKRLIPDAATMDEPTLYNTLDGKVTEIAKKLAPEMEKVPVTFDTLEKINNDLNALQEKQLADAPFDQEGNVKKSQAQFEARLRASESGTMKDLWNTAIEYDNSVPDNVKSANDLSPQDLRNAKTTWRQNRAILRSAITDESVGLGKPAQSAFSDMRDLYEAQDGMMSKAKIEGPKPSLLNQALRSPVGKVVSTAAEAVGLGGVMKGLQIIP
jgi:hypothetical protein